MDDYPHCVRCGHPIPAEKIDWCGVVQDADFCCDGYCALHCEFEGDPEEQYAAWIAAGAPRPDSDDVPAARFVLDTDD